MGRISHAEKFWLNGQTVHDGAVGDPVGCRELGLDSL